MGQRFYFPDKRGMRVVNKDNLLAFFDFIDNDSGLQYADWKLMSGSNGLFVGSPSGDPYTDKNGKKQYPDFVRSAYDSSSPTKRNPKGDAFMTALKEAAVAAYNEKNGGAAQATARPANTGYAAAGRSGAGPMKRPVAPIMDDDEIPF